MRVLEDYALIGDCETAALVGRDGAIDWLCWPRFDSGACLAALLGTDDHGRWKIAPACPAAASRRRYRGDTLILETDFETPGGQVTLIDFMPVRTRPHVSQVVRIVEGRVGEVRMRMDLAVRFDYGRVVPWVTQRSGRLRAVAGPHAVSLITPVPVGAPGPDAGCEFTVRAGERLPFILVYEASHLPAPEICDPETALAETQSYWTEWAARSCYEGPWREAVMRSLITVKALTYRPTGGIVAAPTTSLPEHPGGARNWDYRYCWLRDASFSFLSLINAGFREEAEAWCDWLLRAIAGAPAQIQPLYGIDGTHRVEEQVLDWLPGYAGSRPVRTGNAAYGQLQIDVFGSVMDTLYQARYFGLSLDEATRDLTRNLLSHLEQVWRQPDEGIWEVRGARQHFVHAKLMSWVAFDRAIRSAERFGLPGPADHWRRLRREIHADILSQGFNSRRGAFVQAYGSDRLDAAVLLMPLVGFLPADDPRMISTVDVIERELTRDGLLLRYDSAQGADGLPPGEGAFLACSFWLADNRLMQGRRAEAEALVHRVLAIRNDVGLLAEQYDGTRRRMTGNFPQAFSHFALIDTALRFSGARQADPETDSGRESPHEGHGPFIPAARQTGFLL